MISTGCIGSMLRSRSFSFFCAALSTSASSSVGFRRRSSSTVPTGISGLPAGSATRPPSALLLLAGFFMTMSSLRASFGHSSRLSSVSFSLEGSATNQYSRSEVVAVR